MRLARGFSLLEVVISIFIFGVMLVMAQAVMHSGVLVRTSKNQGIALSIARNELETLRATGYGALPVSGSFTDTLMSTLPTAATAALTVSAYNAKTKQVTATVVWLEPGSTASSTVSLSTLITQTGGLP
jgi:prepilin-type N-terminal cleavage/methylation domain-containing protein